MKRILLNFKVVHFILDSFKCCKILPNYGLRFFLFSDFHLMAQSGFRNDISQIFLLCNSLLHRVKHACIARSIITTEATRRERSNYLCNQANSPPPKTETLAQIKRCLLSSLLCPRELWTLDSHLQIGREESHTTGASKQQGISHQKETLGYFSTEVLS